MAHPAPRLRIASRAYIVIPARLASTRLPRKLLLRETGKSLLQHTYESARRATRPVGLCVAADHREICDEVRSFGGQVQMTDPKAASGTDRVAEVAWDLPEADIVVNVQGDEPELLLPDGRRVLRRHRVVSLDLYHQVNHVEQIFYVTHPDGREERLVHAFRMRYLFRYEAEHLLARCGFELEHVYAGFDRQPYGSEYPGELIMVARKDDGR